MQSTGSLSFVLGQYSGVTVDAVRQAYTESSGIVSTTHIQLRMIWTNSNPVAQNVRCARLAPTVDISKLYSVTLC